MVTERGLLFLLQFELDIEPRLKPSLIGGGGGAVRRGGVNDSQDVSFSQTTKGMQPLQDSVSELEMMTRAGKLSSSLSRLLLSVLLFLLLLHLRPLQDRRTLLISLDLM